MRDNAQSRKWLITINNPADADLSHERIKDILMTMKLKYWAMADEIGAETHTYHTHIFVMSDSPTYFNSWRKRFPTSHLDRAYGTPSENRNYVFKEGEKWAGTKKSETSVEGTKEEWGKCPVEECEKGSLMNQVIKLIEEENMSTSSIIRQYPKLAFKSTDIDKLRETLLSEKYMNENRNDIEVTYIYGTTGTGKTSSIYKKYSPSEVCRITNYKNDKAVFDSYHAQQIIVFEEYRSQIALSELLSYCDRYPLMLPARYYDRVACYNKVYIISNMKLSEQYTYEQEKQRTSWDALIRRVDHIVEQISPDCTIEKDKADIFSW